MMARPKLTRYAVIDIRQSVLKGMAIKDAAKQYNVPYAVAYNAATGRTWKRLTDVPPVSGELLAKRFRVASTVRKCPNCGEDYKHSGSLCTACAVYKHRHGTARKLDHNFGKRVRLSTEQLNEMARRYRAGESPESIACDLSVSGTTVRSRLRACGVTLRPRNRRVLTAGMVEAARKRWAGGEQLTKIAAEFSVSYGTLYAAASGATWREVGLAAPDGDGETSPCRQCEILTDHTSGLCAFCRKGV